MLLPWLEVFLPAKISNVFDIVLNKGSKIKKRQSLERIVGELEKKNWIKHENFRNILLNVDYELFS